MKAIDTNILVRFLVSDDTRQAEQTYTLFKKTEAARDQLFVPLLVVLELIWVLDSVYKIARRDILDALGELLLMPVLQFEQQSAIRHFIQTAQGNSHDLSDLLIGSSARAQGCDGVWTFDKKSARHSLFAAMK